MATLSKKKIKSKAKQKPKTGSKDKAASYVESLDLMEMWETFAHSYNKENGTLKYKTVWSFITSYTKNPKERDILYWMLGPKVELAKNEVPKYSFEQFDWEHKRRRGFWYSSENIETLQQDVHLKASAYESVKAAGKVNIETIAILNALLKKILDEFGGDIFLPNLSMKENAMRSQLLLQLVDKITQLSSNMQLMYAKTQGLDLERLDQFFQMFGTGMGRAASMLMGNTIESSGEGEANHLQKQFAKVVNMVTTKATEYDLPVPTDIADAIKEVESKSSVISIKKQKVQ